jgi:esterase/lipase
MGQRGSRRRARATILAVAYTVSVTVVIGVLAAFIADSPRVLRGIALGAAVAGISAMLMVRHQLLVERASYGEERSRVAQEYSRLTNARVVENAELIDTLHRRLDKIEHEVATVLHPGDRYSTSDAPTVITLNSAATA